METTPFNTTDFIKTHDDAIAYIKDAVASGDDTLIENAINTLRAAEIVDPTPPATPSIGVGDWVVFKSPITAHKYDMDHFQASMVIQVRGSHDVLITHNYKAWWVSPKDCYHASGEQRAKDIAMHLNALVKRTIAAMDMMYDHIDAYFGEAQ